MTRKSAPAEPPDPPQIPRSLTLRPLQIVGIVFLALIPALGALGVLGERSDALDVMWRVTIVYFFLMVAFRFAGKRELSEMSPFELVTLLMIPEIYSTALNRNNSSLTSATISVSLLFVLVFVTGLLTFRSRKVERLVEGDAAVLVRNGKLMTETLRAERVTAEEIMTEAHKAGIDDFAQIRWAILEVDGQISIIPRRTQATTVKHVSG